MSRQYLNNKYCIRCGRKEPTPYLKKYSYLFTHKDYKDQKVVDIGCGNGRNSDYMKSLGFTNVHSMDMKPDYGTAMHLGKDSLPIKDKEAKIILANYIFMFLDKTELLQLLGEIKRVAAPKAYLMVELYAAKDSSCPTAAALETYRQLITKTLGWTKVRYAKEHMIFINE